MTATATAAAAGMTTLTVRAVRPEAAGVVSLELAAPSGEPLPSWTPGAHIDVLLPGGLLRQYSLCSDVADDRCWRVAVLREPAGRGGSAYVHDRLRPGDTVQVRGPRNNFPLQAGDGPLLFIAGGIGITPLLPMLAAAEQAGRDWRLLYLGSTRASMAFRGELAGYGDRVAVLADDEGGFVPITRRLADLGVELGLDGADPGTAPHLYACGPTPLLDELVSWAETRDPARLHLERFVSGRDSVGPLESDTAFTVETADGQVVEVAADQSILDALDRAGVPVISSCREGTCGTCETTVLEGVPDHRDDLLSEDEKASGETMLICVSRCAGRRLLLDL